MSRPVSAAPWLEHLERHLARGDAEGVHQARVALRRLRVWLELSGHRALDDDLRWLLRALAPVRDFDVLSARTLPGPFRTWVTRQRHTARAQLPALRRARRLKGLLRALHALPPLDARAPARALRDFERRVRARERDWRHAPPQGEAALEALHALRRALRRLRYAREWLGKKVGDLPRRQEALGAVADLALERRVAGDFALRGGPWRAADRRRLEAELARALDQARAANGDSACI